MANGLLDLLGSALGTTPPSYMEGLLGSQAVEDLRKRSIGSGIVNALVGYAAMPKNQNLGLGRILAGAAQAGMQGAQGVYDQATQDYMLQQQISEAKRKQDMLAAQRVAIEKAAAQYPEYADAIRANPELLKEIVAARIKPADSPIAKLNPKDYTPESWAAFVKSNYDTTKLREASPAGSDLTNDRNAIAYANFGGKRFSQLTPQEAQQVNMILEQTKARVAQAGVPSQAPSFKDAGELRKEYNSLPQIKAFSEVQSAFDQIQTGINATSAAGDLTAATKFMKLLDPNSVVRDTELGMAMAATGLIDRALAYKDYIAKGTKLSPSQRADFLDVATQLYNAAKSRKADIENQYADIARVGGLDPKLVIGSPNSEQSLNKKDKEALNWANKNPNDPRAIQIKRRLGVQ